MKRLILLTFTFLFSTILMTFNVIAQETTPQWVNESVEEDAEFIYAVGSGYSLREALVPVLRDLAHLLKARENEIRKEHGAELKGLDSLKTIYLKLDRLEVQTSKVSAETKNESGTPGNDSMDSEFVKVNFGSSLIRRYTMLYSSMALSNVYGGEPYRTNRLEEEKYDLSFEVLFDYLKGDEKWDVKFEHVPSEFGGTYFLRVGFSKAEFQQTVMNAIYQEKNRNSSDMDLDIDW